MPLTPAVRTHESTTIERVVPHMVQPLPRDYTNTRFDSEHATLQHPPLDACLPNAHTGRVLVPLDVGSPLGCAFAQGAVDPRHKWLYYECLRVVACVGARLTMR